MGDDDKTLRSCTDVEIVQHLMGRARARVGAVQDLRLKADVAGPAAADCYQGLRMALAQLLLLDALPKARGEA